MREMTGPGSRAQVVYGIPATLPLKLSAPFKVVGTIRSQYATSNTVSYRVYASTTQSVTVAREDLKKRLRAQGWKEQFVSYALGFESNDQLGSLGFYREGKPPLVLYADVVAGPGGKSNDVQISVTTITAEQVAQIRKRPTYAGRSSLPVLRPIPGSKSQAKAPTSGANGSMSSVWVKTNKKAGDVLSHYSSQLRAAGWKLRTDTAAGGLRVLTYSLKDTSGQEALGTLGIRSWNQGGYVLTVSVQGFRP